ncbi:hypothetical protein [Streptomyces megasporus]|uniref:hypothetical protein n=1 Tax=Streptomyces megasporus TaxID=44060 RepID=UPI0004E22644|nr:hypothetical protein [Streptomyces megasporus]
MDDRLHGLLREAAEAHRPDGARMYARVRQGMSAEVYGGQSRPRTSGLSWPRIAVVTLVATALLLGGVHTVTSLVRDGGSAEEVATVPLPPAPDPTAVAPPDVGSDDGAGPESGPLSSSGSVDPHSHDYWAQSNITIDTREPLTSFELVVRIAQTGGVRDTGNWRTLPEEDFTVTTRETDGALVYRWTLKEGRTVPAGEHVFAVQYDHSAGARDAGRDTYTATATAADGEHTVRGSFRDPSGRSSG